MFDANPSPSTAPVACNPDDIPADERPQWLEGSRKVYGAVEEVQELEGGYACRLPGSAGALRDVAEYVSWDRRCCAFLRWTIRVEPEQGDLWLILTGTDAAKQLMREGFETTDLLPLPVARQAGFDVSRRGGIDGASIDAVARRVNGAASSRP